MPDFVIMYKNNEVYFVEVKFRADGKFNIKELLQDYPYENCYFVVVSKKHIKCLTFRELASGKEITPECRNYLGSKVGKNLK